MQIFRYLILKRPVHLFFAFVFLISACSDDDKHSGVQVVNDNLEGSIEWQFVNVAPAAHSATVASSVSASSSHSLSTTSVEQSTGFSFWRLGVTPSNIPVGASLELSVKVKVANVTGDGVFIALRGDDDSPNSLFFKT